MSNYFFAIARFTINRFGAPSGFFVSLLLSFVLTETPAQSQCAPQALVAPTNLTITAGSPVTPPVTAPASGNCGALYLTWEDTSDNEEGFTLERLANGVLDATFSSKVNKISFTDTGVITGKNYCYRMRAFNSVGASALSNESCATAVYPLANVSASPATSMAGATINVSWNGIQTPTTTDWIGIHAPASADLEFIDWIYVSCSKTAATGRASGSCSYTVPSTLAPGKYELRLFLRDISFRVGTSNVLSVN